MIALAVLLYVLGCVNEKVFLQSSNIRMEGWRAYLYILIWPFSVLASLAWALYEDITKRH